MSNHFEIVPVEVQDQLSDESYDSYNPENPDSTSENFEGILAKIGDLNEAAASLASDALSEATQNAYRADWRRWCKWCKAHGLHPLGPSGQLALYIASLVEQGYKIPTIDRALSAVSLAYRLADKPNPRKDPAVAAVFQGARRRIGIAPDQMTAILPTELQKMVEALPIDEHSRLRSIRNRAALVMGFYGGFRRSELLALDIADIAEVPEGLKILIRRSKTDQVGRGRMLGLPYQSVTSVCPVRALKEWLLASGITEGPVFRTISKDGLEVLDTRLCTRQFCDIVKSAAQRVGLTGKYGGHSLRAGLVTAAVRAKKNPKSIMQQTGHKTMDILMRYVREQAMFEDNAAAGLI
jgi:integrase